MPCACNIPIPNAPTNEIWGPILWKVLHGLAEKSNNKILDMYNTEEKLAWINLVKYTEKILPCPTCREHYKDWLSRNNVNLLKSLNRDQQSIWIRNFFWSLHEEINNWNKKEGISFDLISTLYSNINIRSNIKEFESIIKIVFQHNGVSILAWQNWLNEAKKLQAIYGL